MTASNIIIPTLIVTQSGIEAFIETTEEIPKEWNFDNFCPLLFVWVNIKETGIVNFQLGSFGNVSRWTPEKVL